MISPEALQGLAAEYMVCADLCKAGYPAFLANAGSRYDVVVDINSRLLRIQVKSREKKAIPSKSHSKETYKFRIWRDGKGQKPINTHEVDVVALVAMDIGAIAYISPSYCLEKKSLQLKPPGAEITTRAKQAQNIDQFPFAKLLEELRQ